MLASISQRLPSCNNRKVQARLAKLAEDERRTDGTAIRDTNFNKWIAAPVSWGYENLIHIAVRRFRDFLEIMGPKESRSKLHLFLAYIFLRLMLLQSSQGERSRVLLFARRSALLP